MPSQEERLSIVEQSITTLRMDLLQAISDNTRSMTSLSRAVVQQEQNLRDADHEITILIGVVGNQGQDIKSIKEDLDIVKSDLGTVQSDLSIVKSDLSAVKTSIAAHDKRFDRVDQRLDSLDTKFDQVLLMLSKLISGSQQQP